MTFQSFRRLAASPRAYPLFLAAALLLLCLFLGSRTPYFLTLNNMVNICEAGSYGLILALGMTFIIAAGAIDLSVGSILSLSAILAALAIKAGLPVWTGCLIGVAAGSALGAVNGILFHLTRISPLIVTLATAALFRGLALIITRGVPVSLFPREFLFLGSGNIAGLEPAVWLALLLTALAFPLMRLTRFGHYVKSLGGNPVALERCGVRTGIYRTAMFGLAGGLAALVGLIMAARLNAAEVNAGLGMELFAISAVLVGGTPLTGGRASLAGTVLAVALLTVIRNGLTILAIPSYYQEFLTGAVLLAAVLFAELRIRFPGVAKQGRP